MRILMMARNLVTDVSGPRYAVEISKQMALLGNEVFIPTSNPRVRIENARILKLPRFFGRRAIAPLAYSCSARIIKKKYGINIIHGNGYTLRDDVTTVHYQTGPYTARVSRFMGKSGTFSNLWQTIAEKAVLKSSKHLIAVSNSVKHDLEVFYHIPKERISVVHNGVTLDEFCPPVGDEREKLLQKYGLSTDKMLLLFVGGSAYERKGFKFILDALPYLSDNIVIIAICRSLSRDYADSVAKSKATGKIIVEPYVPEIHEIYKAVDMYVLPTIYDPFPLAVLEAMASRLPVVISSLTGAIDIIENWKNGIVVQDPSSVTELANAVNRLAKDAGMRKEMGLRARATVEKMSWENVAREVLSVYEIVLRR